MRGYRNDLQLSVANIPNVSSQVRAGISAHFDKQPGNYLSWDVV